MTTANEEIKNESQEIIEENLSNIVREEALEEVKSLDEDIASSFVLQLDQGMVNDEILRKNEIVQEDFNEDHKYDEDRIEEKSKLLDDSEYSEIYQSKIETMNHYKSFSQPNPFKPTINNIQEDRRDYKYSKTPIF